MKRFVTPMLFLMANVPDVEKNMEAMLSMLQATTDSIKSIKNGIDNFHATFLKIAQPAPQYAPTEAPPAWTNPPFQAPEPIAKPEPSPERETSPKPAPSTEATAIDPPVS